MRGYEIMLILPPDAEDKVIEGVTDRISQVLADRSGVAGMVKGRQHCAGNCERKNWAIGRLNRGD